MDDGWLWFGVFGVVGVGKWFYEWILAVGEFGR